MGKMMVQILQMKNMVQEEELRRENTKKVKEQLVIEVNKLKQKMFKTKSKLDNLVEKNKDLNLTYVNNKLENMMSWYNIIQYCIPNNTWMIPMLNLMTSGSQQNLSSRKKCKKIQLHTERMRLPIEDIYLPLKQPFQILFIEVQIVQNCPI